MREKDIKYITDNYADFTYVKFIYIYIYINFYYV